MTNRMVGNQEELGNQVRICLQQRLGPERFQLWFGEQSTWSAKDEKLQVAVVAEFLIDCIRRFCWRDLMSAAREVIGAAAEVSINTDPSLSLPQTSQTDSSPQLPPTKNQAAGASIVAPETLPLVESAPFAKSAGFKPAATVYREVRGSEPKPSNMYRKAAMATEFWNEFIEGESNRLARTAGQMVVERPGTINPLVIYGPCGSGKTHLARGIGEQIRQRHSLRRVIYMTAEQFTIDFSESVRGSGFANFRRKYRDVEALILDDVQFMLGKTGTLVELRNTVDNLLRDHRQVIFVADRSIAELGGLGVELHTRLSGGMACGLEPLDLSTREKLLAKLCDRHAISIDASLISDLARQTSGDARVLHGVCFRLLAAQRNLGQELTLADALHCCKDLLRASQPVVRLNDIEKAVCDVFGLEPKSLQLKSKSKGISQPRMLAMFLARKYTRAAYSEIGDYFGNRQHSTVISAQKKVEDWLANNESVDHSRGTISVRDMLRNLESNLQVG
jgi:chromosomal replication initiator protein